MKMRATIMMNKNFKNTCVYVEFIENSQLSRKSKQVFFHFADYKWSRFSCTSADYWVLAYPVRHTQM